MVNRREFLKTFSAGCASLAMTNLSLANRPDKPNIILCMTDDQGWGDTGYNGHPVLKTPHLDAMSRQGIHFDRWYSGAPVCSPTRGSCLTGRHPYRYSIFYANSGHMPPEEITLAEALKTQGYTTGHFGKWHLGTLTKTIRESNRGGERGVEHFSPPWINGFDECFSTEAKVPTWNPMLKPGSNEPYGTYYWTGPKERADKNLKGDDSRIIMDRAVPFIENAVNAEKPFFAVIWFHTPHLPVLTGSKYRNMYADQPEKAQHYYGCITAMDEQIGRLRTKLSELGVSNNTLLWFCSDNGPEGKKYNGMNGSAGPLRGRKRSLYEGGVRVPGLLVWPERIKEARTVTIPCSTSDYYPTIMDILDLHPEEQPEPLDGITLLPLIEGTMTSRSKPIAFESRNQLGLIDNRYKIYSGDDGKTFELYDIIEDPDESKDLSSLNPQLVDNMKKILLKWKQSCNKSRKGMDYE